jgi:hypothetical protein
MRVVAIAMLTVTFALSATPARAHPCGASPDSCRETRRHERAVASGKHPLTPMALVQGMRALKPKLKACYERYGVSGEVMVDVRIAPSGRVPSASATGEFAGTPSGRCVAKAVRTARFPRSDGFHTPYPLYLR